MPQAIDKAGDPVYEVEFWGTYWTYDSGKFDDFRCKVKMNHRQVNEIGIGSVFKGFLGKEILSNATDEKTGKKVHPNFRRLRKFFHGPAVKLSGRTITRNIDMMGREELLKYAENWLDGRGMALELALYDTEAKLKTAVKEYEKDPDGFLIRQNAQMEKYGKKLRDKEEALALNGMDNSISKGVKVKLPKPPKPKAKKKEAEESEDQDYD